MLGLVSTVWTPERYSKQRGVAGVLTAADLEGVENAITRQFYTLTPAFVARHEVSLGPYREPVLADRQVNRVG